MKLLLVGATGLVGSHVLQQALASERITRVATPVRRALEGHPKLLAPVVDFERLPEDAEWWQADAVICTLGTTMKNAGSREAFWRVDHDYPLMVAKLAKQHGTPTYVLNSAIGANSKSRFFYNRVKGEVERDLAALGFGSLTFVRPGLISGERREFRRGEKTMEHVLKALGPLLPRSWRANPADNIARALIQAAVEATPGIHQVQSRDLVC